MSWNFDMTAVPRGETVLQTRPGKNGPVEVPVYKHAKVILAGACGTVTVSRWLPEEERWEMFSKKETPIAWIAWPTSPVEVQS